MNNRNKTVYTVFNKISFKFGWKKTLVVFQTLNYSIQDLNVLAHRSSLKKTVLFLYQNNISFLVYKKTNIEKLSPLKYILYIQLIQEFQQSRY